MKRFEELKNMFLVKNGIIDKKELCDKYIEDIHKHTRDNHKLFEDIKNTENISDKKVLRKD